MWAIKRIRLKVIIIVIVFSTVKRKRKWAEKGKERENIKHNIFPYN